MSENEYQTNIERLTRALMAAAVEAFNAEVGSNRDLVGPGKIYQDQNDFVAKRIDEWMGEEAPQNRSNVGRRIRVQVDGQWREGTVVGSTEDNRCYYVEFLGVKGPWRAEVDKSDCQFK